MTEVLSPVSGRAIPMDQVEDEVFAQGLAGEGVAVVPEGGGEALAPVSGVLVKLFEGGHAFGIAADDGAEVLVHLGLDTIELEGEGFERLAIEGDRVEAGQPLVRFDLHVIEDAGYDPTTPVFVSNSGEFAVFGRESDEVRAGDRLFEVAGAATGASG